MTAQTHPHVEPPPEPDVEDIQLDAGHFFSEEFGTTVAEQRRHEPIDDRLQRELPDEMVAAGDGERGPATVLRTDVPVDAPTDWNLIVTVHPKRQRAARALIARVGQVRPSPYPDDVLIAQVGDAFEALDVLDAAMANDPLGKAAIAAVRPVQHTFPRTTLDALERITQELVGDWLDELAGASFHVRCHHRGVDDDDDIDGAEEEAFLGEVVLKELEARGTPGRIAFTDPDVQTLGGEAGISLWTRDDLHAYPFLRVG